MTQHSHRNAIVLVIDGLRSHFLGPYGNTWIDTPACNQLAAQSLLFETAWTDSPNPTQGISSMLFAGRPSNEIAHQLDTPVTTQLHRIGVSSSLVVDEQLYDDPAAVAGFNETAVLSAVPANQRAEDLQSSHFGRFFARLASLLDNQHGPFLIWGHSCGLAGPWDAPLEMRRQLVEEGDPDPPGFVIPPSGSFDTGTGDPDLLLGIRQAYGAQICLLDRCLAALLEQFEESRLVDSTLLLLASPRGYPMGEHGVIGYPRPMLFSEIAQVPLLVFVPDRQPGRFHTLVQPGSIRSTLLEWFSEDASAEHCGQYPGLLSIAAGQPQRRALVSSWGSVQSIRTPRWLLIREHQQRQLYVKPDDLWEVNEVADRCPEIVQQLDRLLDRWLAEAKGGSQLPFHVSPQEMADP